jgi:hypothetical protein
VADTQTFCESTTFVSFSQIFCTLTLFNVHMNMVYPPLFGTKYFHKDSTLFEKSSETCPFFMNTTLYPWNDSTLCVNLQKGQLGSY